MTRLPTACPKPRPAQKSPRRPLKKSGRIKSGRRRCDCDYAGQAGSHYPGCAALRPSAETKRRRIKPKKRTAGEARRIYGTAERRRFVKDQPCAACGVHMWSVNAHVLGSKGTSLKEDYTTIAPLCEKPMVMSNGKGGVMTVKGCHQLYDEHRWLFDGVYPDFNPETAAANCEAAWQEYQKEKA